MKITIKKSFAVVMALVMCVSVLFGINFSAFAADNTVNYVYSGNYVYNWGTRETDATFLSPMAEAFYTENDIVLSELLALSGGDDESGVPTSTLYSALKTLMVNNHDNETSYDGTRDLYRYTDCQNSGNPSTISCFYSGAAIGPEWDSGSTWNREHTWPNSKGITNGNHENDIMMLRPTSSNVNSSRGNKAYGTTTTTEYYNPNQEGGGDVRGDVARIILYQYVRWGLTNTGTDYNPNSIFGADGVIESQDVLLTWIEEDPVDTWELGRNDAVEAITGTRNVFVDYPELAFNLFNEPVPTGYTSPSGGADVEDSTGGDSTGDSSTTSSTTATITFDDTAKRTSFSISAQVWEENGITFTNNKSSSTSNVADYSNPIRIYKNSEVIVAYDSPITKIEFTANSATYAGYLKTSLESLGEVSVSDKVVTIVLSEPTTSFSFTHTGSATRFNSLTLYAETSSGDSGDSGDFGDSGDTGNTDDNTQTTEVEATISFATTDQRVSQDTNSQVWTNDGLTFTNNKASSTSNVANYSNPVRLYAKSNIVLEYDGGQLKEIVFTADSSSYATALNTSIGTVDGATVSVSGSTVTITFDTPVDNFTISSLSAQVRLDAVKVTAVVETSGGDTTSPVITATTNNNSYGSVEVSGKYITATPATGYEVSGYEITSGSATVNQNGNVFTVEATADVTVQINFVARTQYTVTFKEMGTTTSTQSAYSGDSITLPSITSGDYTVVGWVAAQIDGETTDRPTVYNAGSTYAVTANTTFYALYSRTEAGGSGESNVFAKYTGTITEGDYLIVYDGGAMKAGVSSSRFTYSDVTATNDSIASPDASLIWTVTADGNYYTLYNESTGKYAASTGAKNKAQLLTSVDDKARWTVSGTSDYEFVNKQNAANSVNANLRRNGTYGFACYATSTGGALTLYKRTAAAMTTYYFTGAAQAQYTVDAQANNAEWGTVTVSGTTVSATPAEGYTVSGYEITSGTATVIQEGNTFFVTATSDVVITVNFEALPTYTVTFIENGTEVSSQTTYSGGFIKLPEYSGELDEYTTFNGWAEAENETDTTKIYAAKATFAVTKDVTLYAQFTVTAPPVVESDHFFTKVTEDLTDWTGTYLIVYEAGSVAFNGSMTEKLDSTNNGVGVTIADGKIAATDANIAVSFVVEKIEGGYTIRSKSGLYFGSQSDTNSLLSNATKTYFNNFAIDADGNTTVTGEGGAILRFNATSGQDRFRFYKTASYTDQQPIALYKLDVANLSGAQVTVGADFNVNYYVDVTNIESVNDGDLTMRFTIDEDAPITVNGQVVDGQYVFEFAGITPQRMGDIIKAEVLYKGNLIDILNEYSVKQNALNLLDNDPDNEKLKQFITDMLYYGAAAQKYSGYKKTQLVTEGLENVLGTPNSDALTETYNKLNLTQPTGDVRFRSATVWFDAVNKLIVKVNNPNSDVVKVYVTKEGGTKTELSYNITVDGYMTDEIKVTDFDTIYTFELCDADGNVMQTLEYSVNTYAYSKQNSTNANMVELALALFRLGQSAKNVNS